MALGVVIRTGSLTINDGGQIASCRLVRSNAMSIVIFRKIVSDQIIRFNAVKFSVKSSGAGYDSLRDPIWQSSRNPRASPKRWFDAAKNRSKPAPRDQLPPGRRQLHVLRSPATLLFFRRQNRAS